ncbi:hypothetical protein ACFSFW_15935 [Fredinandcohnia salidurans]|uniref:Uncharacterized protein n=1 Tax=Fredinandcohnia salidurans TaxID=2595041 RepID=A0ABW4MRP9_9BACI
MQIEVTIKEACTAGFWSCLQLTDWIQMISVAIAMIAGIAAWKSASASKKASKIANKQLEIINKQRIDSVRPELFMKNEKYVLRYNKEMHIGLFSNGAENTRSSEVDGNLYLSINNIGEGHAKNIKIKWDFEVFLYIKFIKEHQKDNQFIVNYEEGNSISFNEGSSVYLDTEFENSEPIFITNQDYRIRLPYFYTRILSIYIHILNAKSDFNFPSESLPKLNFSITYNDVLKNLTIKRFTITPQITQKGSSTEDGEISCYELEVLLQIDEIT